MRPQNEHRKERQKEIALESRRSTKGVSLTCWISVRYLNCLLSLLSAILKGFE